MSSVNFDFLVIFFLLFMSNCLDTDSNPLHNVPAMNTEIALEVTLLGGTLADVKATCSLDTDTVLCNYPSAHDRNQPAEESVVVFGEVESATIDIYSSTSGYLVTSLDWSKMSEANQEIIHNAFKNEFESNPNCYMPEFD